MTEESLESLVLSVTKSMEGLRDELEQVQNSLDNTNEKIADLPKLYILRKEAERKETVVNRVLAGVIAAVVAVIGGVVYAYFDASWDQERADRACKSTRSTLAGVITIAVADRQPLPTSSDETRAAIAEQNVRIRELREQLLSLEGTQPEKC